MGGDNTGHSMGNPEGIQDPALPSTSNQPLGPIAPNTRTLASAVEARVLTSLAPGHSYGTDTRSFNRR